jgi:hypothetical protein
MVASQAHSNQMAGQIFAVENNPIENVQAQWENKNWLGVLDIADQEWWQIENINPADTPRGITLANQNIICRQVSAKYSSRQGTLSINASFDAEVDGVDGVPYDFPDEVPDVGGDDPVIEEGVEANAVVTAGSMYYLPYGVGSWDERDTASLGCAHLDPFNVGANPTLSTVYSCGLGFIKKSTDGTQTWTVLSPGNPPNTAGDSPAPTLAGVNFIDSEASLVLSGHHAWVGWWVSGSGEYRSWVLATANGGSSFTWSSL